MGYRRRGAAAVAAVVLLSGCSSAPEVNENPTPGEVDAYLVAVTRYLLAEAGAEPQSEAEMLAIFTPSLRAEGLNIGLDTCRTLRDEPEKVRARFTLEGLAEMTGKKELAEFRLNNGRNWIDVEHFCPSLRERLDEVSKG